jgi:endogenous inhibitor of DNA gyrase (YacG/DUF329 family)
MKRKTVSATCPICGHPPVADAAPFCSVRCKDEDLRRWLVGAYRIPGGPAVDPEDEGQGMPEEKR